MKRLKCSDINENGCGYVAKGRTSWDVVRTMFNHAAREHKEVLIDITNEDQMKMIELMKRKMINVYN